MSLKRLPWLVLPLGLLGLDWLSKVWVLKTLADGQTKVVIPDFFNLSLAFNKGAIFGSFSSAPDWLRVPLFVLAGAAAVGYFGHQLLKDETPRLERVALGLILGGAAGNGLDRLMHGAVVDFLDFVIRGWHYWTFNLADSCIVCGAILYGLSMVLAGRSAKGRIKDSEAEA